MFISSYGQVSVKETEISWYRLLIEIDSNVIDMKKRMPKFKNMTNNIIIR